MHQLWYWRVHPLQVIMRPYGLSPQLGQLPALAAAPPLCGRRIPRVVDGPTLPELLAWRLGDKGPVREGERGVKPRTHGSFRGGWSLWSDSQKVRFSDSGVENKGLARGDNCIVRTAPLRIATGSLEFLRSFSPALRHMALFKLRSADEHPRRMVLHCSSRPP